LTCFCCCSNICSNILFVSFCEVLDLRGGGAKGKGGGDENDFEVNEGK